MAEIIVSEYKNVPVVTAFIDNKLEFVQFVRKSELHDIYLGRVDYIVKNIDAAFVRYRDDEIGYLPLKSVLPACVVNRTFSKGDTLKAGDEVIVQVEVEKQKTKKARLTTYLALSGRYNVVTLGRNGVGASLKLDDKMRNDLIYSIKEEYKSLSDTFFDKLLGSSTGTIIRTNASDLAPDNAQSAILEDAENCIKNIIDILGNGRTRTSGTLLFSKNSSEVSLYIEKARAFLKSRGITDPAIINDTGIHGIPGKIDDLQKNKVWLKSGAYLIIEQLESFNAIDVNTGKAISGKKDISLKVNEEAANEIMRQVRLRNLTGMILIDFINMKESKAYDELTELVKKLARIDPVHTAFVDITGLGIMELTRNKNDKSLKEILQEVEKAVDISKHQ